MATDYSHLLAKYPEKICQDQFYRICRISKRKATWLLENGYIPCEDTGKKTRRFKIRITDVVEYLTRLEDSPGSLLTPPGIFSSKKPTSKTNYVKISSLAFANLLEKQWLLKPDALNTKQISELLGYTTTTVAKWIKTGKLKAIPYQRSYLIPKKWLIHYLAETVNDDRASKSEMHMKLINNCQKN